jgi:hypothetical protein
VLVVGGVTATYTDTAGDVTASAELFGAIAAAAPRAVGDAYTTSLGASLVLSAPGVLRNDRDLNGDVLRAVLVSGPAHGTLMINFGGSLRYKPFEDYIGADAFRYKASDGTHQSAAATVVKACYRAFITAMCVYAADAYEC